MAGEQERKKRPAGFAWVGSPSPPESVPLTHDRPGEQATPSLPPFLEVKQRNLFRYPGKKEGVQEEGGGWKGEGHLKEGDKQPGQRGNWEPSRVG